MKYEIFECLWTVMQWVLVCPLVGFILTVALFGILNAAGYIYFRKNRAEKVKCFTYVTVFVFGLAVLLRAFAT